MSRQAAEKARFVGLIRGKRLPGAKVKNLEKRGAGRVKSAEKVDALFR